MEAESLLTRLEGCELAQVWFVRDYLQLIFESNHESWSWQCYTWPHLTLDGEALAYGDPGYRDGLCSLIDSTVTQAVESRDSGLAVSFASGSIVLNPTAEEVVGPEIAMLSLFGPQRGDWMVWQPGEDTFAHLR